MPEAHAASYKLNPFDVTKVWPHSDYPRIRVGEVVLNRNPLNYFADVEQAAFAPSACTIIAMVAFGSMVMVAVHFSKADKEYGAQVEAGLARAKPGDPRQVSVVK